MLLIHRIEPISIFYYRSYNNFTNNCSPYYTSITLNVMSFMLVCSSHETMKKYHILMGVTWNDESNKKLVNTILKVFCLKNSSVFNLLIKCFLNPSSRIWVYFRAFPEQFITGLRSYFSSCWPYLNQLQTSSRSSQKFTNIFVGIRLMVARFAR